MAINPIYRESWAKKNGWLVRVDFVAAGGTRTAYDNRSVTNIIDCYKSVTDNKNGFDKLPFGLADAASCKFNINYSKCPTDMQVALDSQYSGGVSNLFVVWSDRGTGSGQPATFTITNGGTGYLNGTNGAATTTPSLGSGLTVDITASAIGIVNAIALVNGGTGYSDNVAAGTVGGTGTGCTLDITTFGGVITTITAITAGGSNYTVGDVLAIVGGTSGTAEVQAVTGTGAISSLALHGGTGYAVNDIVYIGGGNSDAYITINTLATSTWSVEFVGSHRVSPDTVESVAIDGTVTIEVEAVSVYKTALDAPVVLSDIMQASVALSPADYVKQVTGYVEMTRAVDASTTYEYLNLLSQGTYANMLPLSTLLQAIGVQCSALVSTATMQTIGVQLMGCDFTSMLEFDCYKQAAGAYGEISALGAMLAWSDVYVCINIHSGSVGDKTTVYNTTAAIGGLFSEDEAKLGAKTYWELFKQLCEQFYVKATPKPALSSTSIYTTFNFLAPYGTAYSVPTVGYDGGGNEVSWERNSGKIGKIKFHQNVGDSGVSEWERYIIGKSDDGIEVVGIFSADYLISDAKQTPYDDSGATLSGTSLRKRAYQFNTLGLFYFTGTTAYAVNCRMRFRSNTVTGYVTDAAGTYVAKNAGQVAFTLALQGLQDAANNFKAVAYGYLTLFGVGTNQTRYNMQLQLSTDVTSEKIGQAIDVTPHSSRTSVIATRGFIVESTVHWDAESDIVDVAILTKAIEYA